MNKSMMLRFFNCSEDEKTPSLPIVKTNQSACADVKARFHTDAVLSFDQYNQLHDSAVNLDNGMSYVIVEPGERMCIPTGWRIIIEHGYQIKLVPRSGMALKFGITLLNSPGTIDSDYTDELKVIVYNASKVPYRINEGDSIAQMEVMKNYMPEVQWDLCFNEQALDSHKASSNRDGGFGSTGR